jgi:hypothetical protein
MLVRVAVPMRVVMAMIVVVIAILIVNMRMRLGMAMRTGVRMTMIVSVSMIVMAMIMVSMPMPMPVGMAVIIIGPTLGLERTRHNRRRASKPADHFGQHMIVFEIKRISGQFAGRMAVADMPSRFQKPQRVFGPDFQQRLRRGLNQHQPAILKFDRIAVVQHGGLVEVEEKLKPVFTAQGNATAMTPLMVKANRVNNPLRFNGGFTDDGNGTLHQKIPLH